MKVINVVPAVSNEASGPSYSVVRLCESLIQAGKDVTLAALDWAPIQDPPPFLKTFPVSLGPKRLGRSRKMNRWLQEEATSKRLSLLHNHSLWLMPNAYPGFVAGKNGIPYLVSPRGTLSDWAMRHGSIVKKPFWNLVQRPSLASVSCFHATAMSEYEDIRRMGFRQPVAIVRNGIDIPPFIQGDETSTRTLLFLGRVHPKKGLDILLKAWSELQDSFPDWNLRVVGPDNDGYLDRMRAMAGHYGLVRCEFSGPLYGAEKFKAYSLADLFVLPTHSENFGLSVAEALASGTPAIVSKGAPWSGLEEHDAGWWVDLGVEPLVAALRKGLSCSRHDLQLKGRNGREWMQREFSWAMIGKQMSDTYDWMVYGGVRPSWVVTD